MPTGTSAVHHRYATVHGQRLLYREAGPRDAPTVLLHGFPASSFMFRDLIPGLGAADQHLAVGGHFLLESQLTAVGQHIHRFLRRTLT